MSDEDLKKFKEEILLNRECSGESNYIFVDDEEILQLINLIEKLPNKIRDKIKELDETKQYWTEEVIDILKSIIGE